MQVHKPKEGYKLVESLFGRYEEIPQEWNFEKIQDNSTLKGRIGWQGLTTSEYRQQGKFYLVTGTDFKDGKIDWKNCVYIDEDRYVQDTNIQLRKDDVLVTKDGTIGKIAFVDILPLPATLNSGIFVVRPTADRYFSLFLYHILYSDHFIKFLNRLKAGSTINHLYQKDFVNFYFPIPSIQEQQKIASILSKVDDLIQKTDEIIEQTQQLKKGLMQKLLTKGIGHAKFKNAKSFFGKYEKIPEEWEVTQHDKVCEFINGYAYSQSEFTEKGYPIIRIQNLNGGKDFVYSNVKLPEKQFAVAGDLLFAWSATFGPFIWDGPKAAYHYHQWKVIPKESVDKKFLYYHFARITPLVKLMGQSGLGMFHMTKSGMEKLHFFKPPLQEQQRISSILGNLELQIVEYREYRSTLELLKKGLMQKLLTGQIKVKV